MREKSEGMACISSSEFHAGECVGVAGRPESLRWIKSPSRSGQILDNHQVA
jgi:hypothetical protein